MKAGFTYLLLFGTLCVSAQTITDTVRTLTLPAAEKLALSSVRVHYIQDVARSKSLTESLRENTAVYLKSYGNGQLTSLSYRGTGAAQNDLLWNGIKLNSPSLGQVDMSLFSLGMADALELTPHSEAGNVGASFNLINQTAVDSAVYIHANITYGSFNTLSAYAHASFGNGKVMGTTRASYLRSDNDYSFANMFKAGNPEEKQRNGQVSTLHFMQQIAANINPNNTLFFNLWLSEAQRQIPPIMSKSLSRESQEDYSARTMLTWKGKMKGFRTNFTSAYLYDVLRYRNPEIYLDDQSVMQAFRNNFTFVTDTFKNVWVTVDAGYEYEQASVPAYTTVKRRHIGKLSAMVSYQPVKELLLQLKLREHVYSKTLSPFSPFFSLRYTKKIRLHTLQFHLNASRNFRFPTLNDLYWIPGGNQNLKTEKSWDGEIQGVYNYTSHFTFKASGFAKYITDLIQWQPNGTYWEPLNVKRVLTRGAEFSVYGWYHLSPVMLSLSGNYSYTRATNLDAITPFDQSKGKQLIYVPLHLLKFSFRVEWREFHLRPVLTYTDKVFITTDNSQSLKGYALLDLEIGKDFLFKHYYQIDLAFRVNNIANTNYQNVAQRPMPGRSFEGTVRFHFKR